MVTFPIKHDDFHGYVTLALRVPPAIPSPPPESPWVPEVEALRDTMNGNPEGGRKKIQRKVPDKTGGETMGFDGDIFEGKPWDGDCDAKPWAF